MQHAQQLGRYHLLDRVAFGGMAEIYRAKTADAQGRLRLVAVKRVLGHLCEDDEFIQMLIDEARLTALLNHANIARLYEFSRVGTEYFIAMEYVDGKDMRALLERARQAQELLPEQLIAYIGMQVARGLNGAHLQTDSHGNPLNIVHRDVSPSNVLLSYEGEVKLCDFGIAKASGARSQTKTGVIKGKVKYMSPEQAMGRKLDHRSDLFSLGTLLYEMLTLQAPFTAQTEIELLFAVRDARKRPIRELRPDLHRHLEGIINCAMEKQRSQRFQTGEEFARALQEFLESNYPGFGRPQLANAMKRMFEREREREQAVLGEYVIDAEKADLNNLGENLLADVLGPDAEYTQFTAAFGRDVAQMEPMTSPPYEPAPLRQMEMSSLSMSGGLGDDLEGLPTMQKDRLPASELGAGTDEDWAPSASTIPRGASPSAQTAPRGVPAPAPMAGAGPPPPLPAWPPSVQVEEGLETMIIQRDAPSAKPMSMKAVEAIASHPSVLFDDQFHSDETQILSRAQVDLLKPPVRSAPVPGLHEASTQILDMRSLPPEMQALLARRGSQVAAQAMQQPTPQPAPQPLQAPTPAGPKPSGLARAPSMQLQPLDSDFHEANTAYLDWSPLAPAEANELPEPSSMNAMGGRLGALRSSTGAHAPVALPPRPVTVPPIAPPGRSPTAPPVQTPLPQAQPVVGRSPTAPPLAPSRQPSTPPLAPRPSSPLRSPTAPPVSATPRPTAAPPVASPRPSSTPPLAPRPSSPLRSPTAPPVSATPRPAASPLLGATPGRSPVATPSARSPVPQVPSAPQRAVPSNPPQPPVARPAPIVTMELNPDEEEWEALPHLDSTMLSINAASARPPAAAGPRPAPVIPRPAVPAPRLGSLSSAKALPRDRGDMPTLPAAPDPRIRPGIGPGMDLDDPGDHTFANLHTSDVQIEQASAPLDDLPTPVKGTALPDLGVDPSSEFGEDTNKGDGPRGMRQPRTVTGSLTLEDDDLETVE
jgi:serine/threonine-protein kinase